LTYLWQGNSEASPGLRDTIYLWLIAEGKQACQRALVADRQAIIERAEVFVHQLQEDLARCSMVLANVVAILAELTTLPRWIFN
jgi:hypothetical protein